MWDSFNLGPPPQTMHVLFVMSTAEMMCLSVRAKENTEQDIGSMFEQH